MSRIGKKPVSIPDGVNVQVAENRITVKGKGGELSWEFHPNMDVQYAADRKEIVIQRPDDQRLNRSLHGLTRALISNMVQGVVTPFEKRLEIQGVGYNASLKGKTLELQVGFANAVKLPIPPNVTVEVPDATHVVVRSANKQAVGQFAAEIRRVRPPEPYKGKGVRYQGEYVRRKAGKAFASGGK